MRSVLFIKDKLQLSQNMFQLNFPSYKPDRYTAKFGFSDTMTNTYVHSTTLCSDIWFLAQFFHPRSATDILHRVGSPTVGHLKVKLLCK